MKIYLIICILSVSLSVAAPILENSAAQILSSENENDSQGNYKFSFATSNGITRTETGTLVNIGEPNEHLAVIGVYSYIDTEGKFVEVHYTADENGYHIDLTSLVAQPELVPSVPSFAVPANVVASLLG